MSKVTNPDLPKLAVRRLFSSESLLSAGKIRLVAHFLLFIAFPSSDSRFLIKPDDFGRGFFRLIRDGESDKKIV